MGNDGNINRQLKVRELTTVWTDRDDTLIAVKLATFFAVWTVDTVLGVHLIERSERCELELFQESNTLGVAIFISFFLGPAFVDVVAPATVLFETLLLGKFFELSLTLATTAPYWIFS